VSAGRVLVVGSLNVDLVARVERLPVAGETVTGADLERTPGGKGLNQAVAAARAGATVALCGHVGDDDNGRWLRSIAEAEGIDVQAVGALRAPTGTALITVAGDGANTIVVSPGANRAEAPVGVVPCRGDVVLCQAEIPQAAVTEALAAGRAAGATTVVNLAPFRVPAAGQWELIDVLVVNETELAGLLTAEGLEAAVPSGAVGVDAADGGDGADRARATGAQAARRLLGARPGPGALVVTLGEAGAVTVEATGAEHPVAAPRVEALDTVGAGDCVTGWLAAGLAEGLDLPSALGRAVVAASIAVRRPGAALAMPTATEVRAAEAEAR
jgi:ribokinase